MTPIDVECKQMIDKKKLYVSDTEENDEFTFLSIKTYREEKDSQIGSFLEGVYASASKSHSEIKIKPKP